jgi:hypothetical protein
MRTDGDYYDPDEDARPSSPGLVPTQINYKPVETPPPYIPSSASSCVSVSPESPYNSSHPGCEQTARATSARKAKKRRRKKGRTRPSQGDAVLISYLDPNRPDIAREVARQALNSASQSEVGDEEEEEEMSHDDGVDDGQSKQDHSNGLQAKELESKALAALGDPASANPSVHANLALHKAMSERTNGHCLNNHESTTPTSLNHFPNLKAPLRSLYPPLPLKIQPSSSESNPEGDDDSIATSPALAKFAISAAEANPASTLPAMQKSPPRSTSSHSPEGTQSLPSIHTALSQIADQPIVETPSGVSPFPTSQSPTMSRSQFAAGTPGPSPSVYSQPSPASSKDMMSMSSPGYASHPAYWRGTPKEGSFSTTSPTSVPGLTPVTPYTTTKDMASPDNSAAPQLLNGPLAVNGPFTSSAFKCTHLGCTALPFQTQYLLNSHANVHSSNRPHYCSVKSCPRSQGGKGFKRKNEMIRHGLVHESPGYVCPFCADQQHKYPRPDNLQRRVQPSSPGIYVCPFG